MGYKISITSAASIDIAENIDWYNNEVPGLGNKFYNQIKSCLDRIGKNPFLYAIRYKSTRTAILKSFPFMIHYYINEESKTIIILSILHTSRSTRRWEI
jgi:plasmid stabilization system protein ParE